MKYFTPIFTAFLACILFSVSPVQAQKNKKKLLYAKAILFNSGQAKLKSEYHADLEEAVNVLNTNAKSEITIHGHTDSVGTYKDNELLANNRALAVYNYLAKLGADTSKIEMRAYGEYSPFGDDGTTKGRAQNRRVTLYVQEPYNPDDYIFRSTISGRLTDAKSREPLNNAMILFNYLENRDTVYTDDNGYYEYTVLKETRVETRTYAKGYFFISKVTSVENKQVHTVNFSLERAILGGKMLFQGLYFRSGTAELLPSSEKAMEGLLAFMNVNNELKIEIGGHINKPNQLPVSETSTSFKLSEARAKTVYDYLLDRGIDANRLAYQGYGNWEMINPLAKTELQMQVNRRVEIKVIE
ncbi:MAG: OmpA family protein [Saprospiraceae bacterium]|nr:OmpA family protein [Saprospiraceae bacterium]